MSEDEQADDVSQPLVCAVCLRANNPKATWLTFSRTPNGRFVCSKCVRAEQNATPDMPFATANEKLVVIACPAHGGMSHVDCNACAGLGVVRVAENSIPVYVVRERSAYLMESGPPAGQYSRPPSGRVVTPLLLSDPGAETQTRISLVSGGCI